MTQLAPADADMFWHSQYRPSDQFALYCFAAQPDSTAEHIQSELARRRAAVTDLDLRVAPAWRDLAFPRWVSGAGGEPVIRHDGPTSWTECTELVAGLLTDRLDATAAASRLHLIGPICGAPCSTGPVWVVVLQVSHALADGRGVAGLARALLGGDRGVVPPIDSGRAPGIAAAASGALVAPLRMATGLGLGLRAWRQFGKQDSGKQETVPAPVPQPATALNRMPGDGRRIDLIVVGKDDVAVADFPVTVSVLARLAEALAAYLAEQDDVESGSGEHDRAGLSVELTVGRSDDEREPGSRNNFHNVAVGVRPDLPIRERAAVIAAQITAAQERDRSPSRRAERRAAAITPPVLRALAARLTHHGPQAPGAAPSGAVLGAVVVSSVNRGPADLTLAGGPVLFTAGFPALSSVHIASVGVHGLGDTVTVSVTTDPKILVTERLIGLSRAALQRTVEA